MNSFGMVVSFYCDNYIAVLINIVRLKTKRPKGSMGRGRYSQTPPYQRLENFSLLFLALG